MLLDKPCYHSTVKKKKEPGSRLLSVGKMKHFTFSPASTEGGTENPAWTRLKRWPVNTAFSNWAFNVIFLVVCSSARAAAFARLPHKTTAGNNILCNPVKRHITKHVVQCNPTTARHWKKTIRVLSLKAWNAILAPSLISLNRQDPTRSLKRSRPSKWNNLEFVRNGCFQCILFR